MEAKGEEDHETCGQDRQGQEASGTSLLRRSFGGGHRASNLQ
jgi:hypothetical protein